MKLASWPLIVAGAFALVAPVCARAETEAQIPPPFPPEEVVDAPEYLLRLNEEVGDRFNYQILIRTEVKPDEDYQVVETAVFSLQASVSAEVVEVAANEITYLYSVKVESVQASGQFAPFAGPITDYLSGERTVKLDKRARRIGDEAVSTGLLGATFPENPIRLGESWTSTTIVDGEPVETVATFMAVESVFGNEALRIEVTPVGARVAEEETGMEPVSEPGGPTDPTNEQPMEEPSSDDLGPRTVTLWIDPETGRTLRASLNQTVQGAVGTTSTMVRQEINPEIALPPVETEYTVVFEPREERWLYNV
ncbi:MAG: hypothetical protein ACOCX1_04880, partial [Fimbriimonadaceae bacterium]